MFLSSFKSNWALVFLVLSQHVWAVLLYFPFVVCPCFHFLCALHFSSLRSSLLSQVDLLPNFSVFLNNALNQWCMLNSRKFSLGSELSETGGGGEGGRECAANLFSSKGNKCQLSSNVDDNSELSSRGVTQVAAYNQGDFLNEDAFYMVVLWFGYIWGTFSQNSLTADDHFWELWSRDGLGRCNFPSRLIHWHFKFWVYTPTFLFCFKLLIGG